MLLDWDVIYGRRRSAPSELLHLESQTKQAGVGFISPLFVPLLPLPNICEDLRLVGITEETPAYTRSVRSPQDLVCVVLPSDGTDPQAHDSCGLFYFPSAAFF